MNKIIEDGHPMLGALLRIHTSTSEDESIEDLLRERMFTVVKV